MKGYLTNPNALRLGERLLPAFQPKSSVSENSKIFTINLGERIGFARLKGIFIFDEVRNEPLRRVLLSLLVLLRLCFPQPSSCHLRKQFQE